MLVPLERIYSAGQDFLGTVLHADRLIQRLVIGSRVCFQGILVYGSLFLVVLPPVIDFEFLAVRDCWTTFESRNTWPWGSQMKELLTVTRKKESTAHEKDWWRSFQPWTSASQSLVNPRFVARQGIHVQENEPLSQNPENLGLISKESYRTVPRKK